MASRKTYDTDLITLRRIFTVTPGTNAPIPSGKILATTTTGEAHFVNPLSVPAISSLTSLPSSIFTKYLYVCTINTSTINAEYGNFMNGVYGTSDRRIKTNIVDANLETCYSTVRDLPLHYFGFISSFSERKRDKNQLGFIADELSTIFPKSVFIDSVINTTFSTIQVVNYEQIQMAHFGATQYMANLLEQHKSTIVGQNVMLVEQTDRFTHLETKVNQLTTLFQTFLSR